MQGKAKARLCELAPAARGSQKVGFTQHRDHLTTHLCSVLARVGSRQGMCELNGHLKSRSAVRDKGGFDINGARSAAKAQTQVEMH